MFITLERRSYGSCRVTDKQAHSCWDPGHGRGIGFAKKRGSSSPERGSKRKGNVLSVPLQVGGAGVTEFIL